MSTAFRRDLEDGRPLVGTVVASTDLGMAELVATRADCLWIDLEHGTIGPADVQPLAIAARAGGAAALVRLADADGHGIQLALDCGADGVVVPHVESAADAERVVARLRYPPRGSRGSAARRASLYGLEESRGGDPVCMVQIESKRALQYADAIAAVDGVDALVAGCADLAVALGEVPLTSSGRVRDAIRHVQGVAHGAGIASGVAGPDDPELLAELAGGRSSLLVLGADVRLFARAVDTATSRLRALVARTTPDRKESHVRT